MPLQDSLTIHLLGAHRTMGISGLDSDRHLADGSIQPYQNWFLSSTNGEEDWSLLDGGQGW